MAEGQTAATVPAAHGGRLGKSPLTSKPRPVQFMFVHDAFPLPLKAGAPCSGLSPQPQGTDFLMGIFFPFIHISSGFARAFLQAFDLGDSWEFSIHHYSATVEDSWSSGVSVTQANSTMMVAWNVAGGGLYLAGVEAQLRG